MTLPLLSPTLSTQARGAQTPRAFSVLAAADQGGRA